jgi:hypothetical protein
MLHPASDRDYTNYVVSFVRLHERGFTAPGIHFMRGLCYHCGVELHNFAPNAISQAATFVAVCEGFLGIPTCWDLWVHLFHAELHTLVTGEVQTHRAVRAGGLTLALRDTPKELYPLCRLTDAGLGAASIIANLHHRRVVPLMERELCIFKMSDAINPVSLARSRLLQEHFPKEYATTRARRSVILKSVPHSDDDL